MYPWISHTLNFGFNFVKISAACTWTFTVVESDNVYVLSPGPCQWIFLLDKHLFSFSCPVFKAPNNPLFNLILKEKLESISFLVVLSIN